MSKLRDYIDWKPAIPSSQIEEDDRRLAVITTIKAPAVRQEVFQPKDILSVTNVLLAIRTLPMPVPEIHKQGEKKKPDYWLWLLVAIVSLISVFATIYSYQHQDILLLPDSYSHMRISRNVIDSLTPGLGQLGYSWLPLPQLIMLPFIWNDYLYQTGLAGSIPSMICYLVASISLFLTARRLTKNSAASLAGTFVFSFNPNVFYMQTTPLTEALCLATFAIAGFFFVAWAQEGSSRYLLYAALGAFFATIARYDGWFLFLSMLVLIVPISFVRQQSRSQIQANLILFGMLGSLGIILWLVWNMVIFGDPFTFTHGAYSSHTQMLYNFPIEMKIVTHNLFQSARYYFITCLGVVGPFIFILAGVSLVLFVIGKHTFAEKFAIVSFITPLTFYVVSFYTGQVVSLAPGDSLHLFNARFGIEAMLPAALFIAMLPCTIPKLPKWSSQVFIPIILSIFIISQSISIFTNGILTLEEGQFGWPCTMRWAVNEYLVQHYNGGLLLEDLYLGSTNESQEAGIHADKIIYQGSQHYWKQALQNPGSIVDWILIDRSSRDLYPVQVNTTTSRFQSDFKLVVSQQGFQLYQRNGLRLLPTRPSPSWFLSEHPFCETGKLPPKGGW